MPCAWPVTEDMKSPEHFPLAVSEVHYQGDGVAVVIADTRAHAVDAAELVEVDYEPLDAIVDVAAAAEDGSTLVHEELGTNVSLRLEARDGELRRGRRRRRQAPLRPAAADPERDRAARRARAAGAGRRRDALVGDPDPAHPAACSRRRCLGMSETKLRVIAPDVGGGFGSKLDVYAEELLAVALARRLGTPDQVDRGAVGERDSRRSTAVTSSRRSSSRRRRTARSPAIRADVKASMGAYLQLVTPGIPLLGAWIYAGPYAIPNYDVTFTGVFTNTTPTDAYRGAGRPEATYVLERTMDVLAKELGIDRIELRRRNFITEFPATMASGLTIDGGDYHASLDRLLEHLGLDEIEAEQRSRRDRGDVKQIGVGFSTYNEMCGLAPSRILGAIRYAAGGWDTATIRCLPTGTVPGRHRHVPARPGPRDGLVADRRRPARLRPVRGRGAARRHERLAVRDGHLRQPQPAGRRCGPLDARARRSSRRRARSSRTSSRSRPTTSSTRTAPSRSRARPTRR